MLFSISVDFSINYYKINSFRPRSSGVGRPPVPKTLDQLATMTCNNASLSQVFLGRITGIDQSCALLFGEERIVQHLGREQVLYVDEFKNVRTIYFCTHIKRNVS